MELLRNNIVKDTTGDFVPKQEEKTEPEPAPKKTPAKKKTTVKKASAKKTEKK